MKLPATIQAAARAALGKKAEDVVALDLRPLSCFTDHFLLATAGNQKQLVAITDAIEESLRGMGFRPNHLEGYPRQEWIHLEGYPRQEWILLDYGGFVVHLFTQRSRAYYGLDRLWGEATRVEISG